MSKFSMKLSRVATIEGYGVGHRGFCGGIDPLQMVPDAGVLRKEGDIQPPKGRACVVLSAGAMLGALSFATTYRRFFATAVS
jgi:hypothetical protein